MSSTALPDFDLQPGLPDGFILVKRPRANQDLDELFTHRRVAIQKKEKLLLLAELICGILLCFWKDALEKMKYR